MLKKKGRETPTDEYPEFKTPRTYEDRKDSDKFLGYSPSNLELAKITSGMSGCTTSAFAH